MHALHHFFNIAQPDIRAAFRPFLILRIYEDPVLKTLAAGLIIVHGTYFYRRFFVCILYDIGDKIIQEPAYIFHV